MQRYTDEMSTLDLENLVVLGSDQIRLIASFASSFSSLEKLKFLEVKYRGRYTQTVEESIGWAVNHTYH